VYQIKGLLLTKMSGMRLLSLNHYWRICAAGISYVLFGLGAFLPGVYIFCLALIPMNQETKQRKVRHSIKVLCRFYVDVMQFLGLMTYTVDGPRPNKLEGHMVISNHSMLIDALFGLAYIDNLCCVVKSALVTNPFTRIPIKLAGYISNSDPDLIDVAGAKLAAGENILIFPEGTRNTSDLQLDFRRGAANMAVINQAPLLPITICCMPRALSKEEKWYQLPDVKSKIVMRFDNPISINDHIDGDAPRPRQYRQLTQALREYYAKAISNIVGL